MLKAAALSVETLQLGVVDRVERALALFMVVAWRITYLMRLGRNCPDLAISMDGRGRAFDNIFVERLWRTIKYEDIYLNGHANMGELMLGLTAYMSFYNEERFHQSLGNGTPGEVYETGIGGGAMILEKYGAGGVPAVSLRSTDGTPPTTATAEASRLRGLRAPKQSPKT